MCLNICLLVFMAVKTLTIKERVYDELIKIKSENESFSDLFERLALKEKPDLMKYAGILSKKEAKEVKKSMKEFRDEFNKDAAKREKMLLERLK